MRRIEKTIQIDVLNYDELTSTENTLLKRACQVRLKAQAPYSHYWVGCSLATDKGYYFDGCNVERVSWTQTDHGEQNAISSAIAHLGPMSIKSLAVVGSPENQKVLWPPKKIKSTIKKVSDICPSCGHCLQIIVENCFNKFGDYDPSVTLLGYNGSTGEIYRTTIGDALPMPFLPKHLGVNYAHDLRFKKIHR
ncbi:MAG: hypothetical protein AAB784_03765 [Patescibacteria group bacterium]